MKKTRFWETSTINVVWHMLVGIWGQASPRQSKERKQAQGPAYAWVLSQNLHRPQRREISFQVCALENIAWWDWWENTPASSHPIWGKNHLQSPPNWNSPLDPLYGKIQRADVITGSGSHPMRLEHSMISVCMCVYGGGQRTLPFQTGLILGRFGAIILSSCFPKLSWGGKISYK